MTTSESWSAGLSERFSEAAGTRELLDLENRLTSLEVAVSENLQLEVTLEELVGDLERVLVEMASPRGGEGMGA